MKGYEQGNLLPGQYFNDEFFNINYTFISNDYLPKDAEGLPDYEAFLERSGMLLPEVIRKKLGQVGLWEQMLTVALYNAQSQGNDPQGMAGLLDYCIHKAPEHLQPAIFRALSNLALVNAEGVVDGKGIYNFLRDKAGDTWLEPLFENPLLLINLVAEDGPVQYGNFAVLDRPESLLDRCFKEIMATPSDQLGFTHFGIFLLNAMDPPEQVLSPDLKPESVIRHMLQGLDGYSLPASTQEFRSEHMNDAALQGCKYVIKTLMARYELDYRALKGISSLGVRVLVEAGLDKRQLPRMNNHDKSRLLSEELGL
jgi:hypothetical protein